MDKIQKTKEFKDSVHGYISIPKKYCSYFIDTEIFQRLRRIEQTSIRVLFPSAHHDRFIHSLGVFYLGRLAFHHLKKNSKNEWINIDWDKYGKTFQIACLLHDCAHSPFSHTFERYYMFNRRNEIEKRLFDLIKSPDFEFDYKNQPNLPIPAEHEIISSIIILEIFGSKIIENFEVEPELIVRMIMGCVYFKNINEEKQFLNCLIRLLNGDAIDVDKLDYILRDTWASGVNNVEIDIHRLLASLCIIRDNDKVPQLAFKKSALSVIDSVIIGRNFLFQWIYSHHKVIYEQYIINKAVEKLSAIISRVCGKDNINYFLNRFFSIDALIEKVKLSEMFSIYLPTDGDVFYLLKLYIEKIPEAKELISREYKYKPLWKTQAEFRYYFKGISKEGVNNIEFRLKNELGDFLKKKCINDEPIIEKVEIKLVHILKTDIYIDLQNVLVRYSDNIFKTRYNEDIALNYFYVFVPNQVFKSNIENDIIKYLRFLKG